MSRIAIISSSQMTKYGRMDAGFHLAVQSVTERVAELEAAGNPGLLVGKLLALPKHAKECVEPLLTGSSAFPASVDRLDRAIQQYPYIAFALAERHLAAARKRAQEKVDQAIAELNQVTLD